MGSKLRQSWKAVINLDATKYFLDSDKPEQSKDVGIARVVLVDDQGTQVAHKQTSLAADAILYGVKNDMHATHSLAYSTSAGLTFEHTHCLGAS